MVKRVLHVSDFSPASRSAFSMARFLAKKRGARLFHAYEGIVPTVMAVHDAHDRASIQVDR